MKKIRCTQAEGSTIKEKMEASRLRALNRKVGLFGFSVKKNDFGLFSVFTANEKTEPWYTFQNLREVWVFYLGLVEGNGFNTRGVSPK